jgi:hypothetical protein
MSTLHDFGDSQNVLRYIQEKSDDIQEVEIPLYPFGHLTQDGVPTGEVLHDVGLIVHCVKGNKLFIHKNDAELVLNDGILNRMKIPIKLRSPQ